MVKRPKKNSSRAASFDLERATAALGKLPTDAGKFKADPRRSFIDSNRNRFEELLANGWTVSGLVKALADEGVVIPAQFVRESLKTEEQLRLDRERRRGPNEKKPSDGEPAV
jgi:hypothetical protein